MRKRIVIVHGWDGSPAEPMHKWLRTELEKRDFEVVVPEMPNPSEPIIEKWVAKLAEIAGTEPDSNTIFVGHSIGCQAILRYLASMKISGFVGGVVLIAPWVYLHLETKEEQQIAKPWIETHIHKPDVWKHIREGKIVAIFSDNDQWVSFEENKIWFEGFIPESKMILEQNKGHFTEGDGVRELSPALDAVLEVAEYKPSRSSK